MHADKIESHRYRSRSKSIISKYKSIRYKNYYKQKRKPPRKYRNEKMFIETDRNK